LKKQSFSDIFGYKQKQCFGSGFVWIRINFSRLDPYSDPEEQTEM
jgi:hypothetical protein